MNERPMPQEVNIVLEPCRLPPERLARAIARILANEAARRRPKLRRALTRSFGEQPNFFIVIESGNE